MCAHVHVCVFVCVSVHTLCYMCIHTCIDHVCTKYILKEVDEEEQCILHDVYVRT